MIWWNHVKIIWRCSDAMISLCYRYDAWVSNFSRTEEGRAQASWSAALEGLRPSGIPSKHSEQLRAWLWFYNRRGSCTVSMAAPNLVDLIEALSTIFHIHTMIHPCSSHKCQGMSLDLTVNGSIASLPRSNLEPEDYTEVSTTNRLLQACWRRAVIKHSIKASCLPLEAAGSEAHSTCCLAFLFSSAFF